MQDNNPRFDFHEQLPHILSMSYIPGEDTPHVVFIWELENDPEKRDKMIQDFLDSFSKVEQKEKSQQLG